MNKWKKKPMVPDEMRPAAQRRRLSEEKFFTACKMISQGVTRKMACDSVGRSVGWFTNYKMKELKALSKGER